MMILANLVNTTGEYILSRLVVSHADAALAADPSFDANAYIGAFYGNFFFWVNIASLVIQGVLVSRIVKYTRMTGVLLLLPLRFLGYLDEGLQDGIGTVGRTGWSVISRSLVESSATSLAHSSI